MRQLWNPGNTLIVGEGSRGQIARQKGRPRLPRDLLGSSMGGTQALPNPQSSTATSRSHNLPHQRHDHERHPAKIRTKMAPSAAIDTEMGSPGPLCTALEVNPKVGFGQLHQLKWFSPPKAKGPLVRDDRQRGVDVLWSLGVSDKARGHAGGMLAISSVIDTHAIPWHMVASLWHGADGGRNDHRRCALEQSSAGTTAVLDTFGECFSGTALGAPSREDPRR